MRGKKRSRGFTTGKRKRYCHKIFHQDNLKRCRESDLGSYFTVGQEILISDAENYEVVQTLLREVVSSADDCVEKADAQLAIEAGSASYRKLYSVLGKNYHYCTIKACFNKNYAGLVK